MNYHAVFEPDTSPKSPIFTTIVNVSVLSPFVEYWSISHHDTLRFCRAST